MTPCCGNCSTGETIEGESWEKVDDPYEYRGYYMETKYWDDPDHIFCKMLKERVPFDWRCKHWAAHDFLLEEDLS